VYAGILIMSSFFRLLACIAPSMVIAQVSCSFAILLNLRVAAVRLAWQAKPAVPPSCKIEFKSETCIFVCAELWSLLAAHPCHLLRQVDYCILLNVRRLTIIPHPTKEDFHPVARSTSICGHHLEQDSPSSAAASQGGTFGPIGTCVLNFGAFWYIVLYFGGLRAAGHVCLPLSHDVST